MVPIALQVAAVIREIPHTECSALRKSLEQQVCIDRECVDRDKRD